MRFFSFNFTGADLETYCCLLIDRRVFDAMFCFKSMLLVERIYSILQQICKSAGLTLGNGFHLHVPDRILSWNAVLDTFLCMICISRNSSSHDQCSLSVLRKLEFVGFYLLHFSVSWISCNLLLF